MKPSKKSITRTFLLAIVISNIIAVSVCALLWSYDEYIEFKQLFSLIRGQYYEFQKRMIQDEVDRVVVDISHWKLKADLRYTRPDLNIIQKDLFESISMISFGMDGNGFIFIGNFDGVELVNRKSPHFIGKNMWDVQDVNGVKVVQEQIKIAKTKPNGDFFTYLWSETGNPEDAQPKMSFIKGVPDWELYVGAGINIDAAENFIAERKRSLTRHLKGQLWETFLIMIFLSLGAFAIARLFAGRIKQGFGTFTSFFIKSAKEHIIIDPNQFSFSEFSTMAEFANKMVSDRNKAEEKLSESEEKYRDFIEGTDDLITKVDKDGKIVFVNYMSHKIFGLSPQDCVGQSAFDFIHPDDREQTQKWFNESVAMHKRSETFENRQVSRNGEEHYMLWTCNFHYDDDGNLKEVNGISSDITVRKRL